MENSDFEPVGTDVEANAPAGRERRLNLRAYAYWESLLEGREFPSVVDIDPESVAAFRDYSILIDFTAGLDAPVLRFIGRRLREEAGIAQIEATPDQIPSGSLISRLTDHYLEIMANRAPIGFEAEFRSHRDIVALYRGILMPLSDDGVTIDFMYGVISWKDVPLDILEESENPPEALGVLHDDALILVEPLHAAELESMDHADAAEGDDVLELMQPASEDGGADVLSPPAAGQAGDAGEGDTLLLGDDLRADEYPSDGVDDSSVLLLGAPVEDELLLDEPTDAPRAEQEADLTGLAAAPEPAETARPAVDAGVMSVATASEIAGRKDTGDGAMPKPVEGDVEADRLLALLSTAQAEAAATRSSDHRTRTALYQALGHAHAFARAALQSPDRLTRLLETAGLKVQRRAPFTPLIKLVFGADYDKTRITEFAAALSHAEREAIAPDDLARFVETFPGGLKGIVQAERAARLDAAGNMLKNRAEALRDALRNAPAVARLDSVNGVQESDEFTLLLARRRPYEAGIEILGVVPDAASLTAAAGRRFLTARRPR